VTVRWANLEEIGSSAVFEALHSGLTVQLIATGRDDLMTCESNEAVSAVMERNTEQYDFIPVTEGGGAGDRRIVGLFHAARFRGASVPNDCTGNHDEPLSEDLLIGADASILDFVRNADHQPCRLVVSGGKIAGLVSLSDLQKLPVRAALFALITGFEMIMAGAIRRKFPAADKWLSCLSDGRQNQIRDEIAKSRQDDGFVDALLFTQFCDKTDIVAKSFGLPQSKKQTRKDLKKIQKLRDNLAHANEYAATPQHAESVCVTVRSLLVLKDEIASAAKLTKASDRNVDERSGTSAA
jgi:CBS domain-containing protein